MKAWIVSNDYEEWCSLFHAETAGKAKMAAIYEYALELDFIDMRVQRLPKLDDKPITHQNAKEAGFEYRDLDGDGDEEGNILPEEFINDCHCDICRKGHQS